MICTGIVSPKCHLILDSMCLTSFVVDDEEIQFMIYKCPEASRKPLWLVSTFNVRRLATTKPHALPQSSLPSGEWVRFPILLGH